MITKPTVLIVGAGGSADYGFPTGRGLLLNICRDVGLGGHVFSMFTQRMEIHSNLVEKFVDSLQKSAAPSVDLFLEYRKEFEDVGKMAIAAELIQLENFENLSVFNRWLPAQRQQRWYETLFSLMVTGGRYEENRLSIITFNYDRSLEAFLFQALQNLYGLSAKEAEDRLKSIPIIHVYGALGTSLTPDDSDRRGYQSELRGDWVSESAKRIKIVHEAKPGGEFEQAFGLLCEAEEILFLGFGFHEVNVKRLRLQEVYENHTQRRKRTKWMACRTEMGVGDVRRAQAFVGGGYIEFAPESSWGINEFLKNTKCLIPAI